MAIKIGHKIAYRLWMLVHKFHFWGCIVCEEKKKKESFKEASDDLAKSVNNIYIDAKIFKYMMEELKEEEERYLKLSKYVLYMLNYWLLKFDEIPYVLLKKIKNTPCELKKKSRDLYKNKKIRKARNCINHALEKQIFIETLDFEKTPWPWDGLLESAVDYVKCLNEFIPNIIIYDESDPEWLDQIRKDRQIGKKLAQLLTK